MAVNQRFAAELASLAPLDTGSLWAPEPALESLTSDHGGIAFMASTVSFCPDDACASCNT